VNAEGKKSDLIVPHDEYLRLGRSLADRKKNYRALFKAHIDAEEVNNIRKATNGNYVLGNERFQAEIASMLKRRVVPGKPGRPGSRSLDI